MRGYLAIDPSFRRSGVAAQIGERAVGFTVGSGLSHTAFPTMYFSGKTLAHDLITKATGFFGEGLSSLGVVIEYPPPVMQFSAGMFLLVTQILRTIEYQFGTIDLWVRLVPPAYTRKIMGDSRASKSEIVAYYREKVEAKFRDMVLTIPKRVSHDLAEAMILLDFIRGLEWGTVD